MSYLNKTEITFASLFHVKKQTKTLCMNMIVIYVYPLFEHLHHKAAMGAAASIKIQGRKAS